MPPQPEASLKIKEEETPPRDEDEDFDGEAEGILADAEGIPFYSDAGFRIRRVTEPMIVQRTLGDLYSMFT